MTAKEAVAKSVVSMAKRFGDDGHMWVWDDRSGGFCGTDRVDEEGEPLGRRLNVEEIDAHDDWVPMLLEDVVDPDPPNSTQ